MAVGIGSGFERALMYIPSGNFSIFFNTLGFNLCKPNGLLKVVQYFKKSKITKNLVG